MKFPAWQFYPGDWKKDPGVQALDYFTRGVWFEILLLMFESEHRGKLMLNGEAMPEEALAQSLGLDKQILTTSLTKILQYGCASKEESTGVIYCRRMVKDENIREIRKKAGKQGGNPILLNQKSTTGDNQKSTPSVSSSSSVSLERERQDHFPECNGHPTIEEVTAKAEFIGLARWKAEDWYHEMVGGGWLDHAHRPIANWESVITRVKVRWEADGRPMAPPGRRQPTTPRKRIAPTL